MVAEAVDPRIGTELLGRYRIVRVLADGGMGRVYLAEQAMGVGSRRVAIKALHAAQPADPQAASRFQQECKTVCELEHPNTIKFHDFGRLDDGSLFIVMEYVEGEPLGAVLRRGPMPVERLDPILVQLAGSLGEAHQKGIVHRDLKPDNVLLTDRAGQTDFVKVLDFGIAKRNDAAPAGAPVTVQGTMLGTPPYMSPEQFRGEVLDGRSDLYSLGIIVFELLTGQLPFAANTPWEWATRHLTEAPRSLDQFPATARLPPHRKEALRRALAKTREERFASVHDFARAFTGLHDPGAAWALATGGHRAPPSLPSASIPPTSYPAPYPTGSGTLVMPPGSYAPPPSGSPARGGRKWMIAIPFALVLGGAGVALGQREGVVPEPALPPASVPVPTPVALPTPAPAATPPSPPPETPAPPAPAPAPPVAPFQWVTLVHHRGTALDAEHALGPADGQYAAIPSGTFSTFETTPGWQFVSDGTPAPDLEIFVDGAHSAAYRVEVVEGPSHDTVVIAQESVRGRAAIDLDAVGARTTQLVRIRNLGGEAVYLDAIMARRAIPGGGAVP